MRTLFAVGAIGEFVKQIQAQLTASGFSTGAVDGWYGNNTAAAAKKFQQKNDLIPSGAVDDFTWSALLQTHVPSAAQRCLQVTAAFEGHGFQLAVGNFDGALLTWGIVGFTVASGEIQEIVQAIDTTKPQLLDQAFGASKQELLDFLAAPIEKKVAWANEHTLPNGSLVQSWRSMFATFGSFPEVQAEQLKHVQSDYLAPAIKTAKSLGFKSELGLALAFDIHVQNGGIKNTALDEIHAQAKPGMSEADLRLIVANAVADSSRPSFIEDVRRRKVTVASGQGTVHGHAFVLENWGLSGNFPANELA